MKILVIDDSAAHLETARQTLEGHDVTVCSSHEQAVELLEFQYNEEKKQELLKAYRNTSKDWYERALSESLLPYWDVVLCDLLMPAGPMAQGKEGKKYVGEEMAVGWSLALIAAKNGAKYVAVASDMNHHDHPASAMLDELKAHLFTIEGAKMLMTNGIQLVGLTGTEKTCSECEGTGKLSRNDGSKYNCYHCWNGTDYSTKGKNWGRVLKQVMGEKGLY